MSNPILRKEVLTSLRSPRTLAMSAAFLLGNLVIIWALWPDRGLQSLEADQARTLLAVLAAGQLLLVAMFAPAMTASALTIEKERNTFESLLATRLRPREIVLGKMAGSLTFLLVLVGLGSPMLASLLLLGGVGIGQILAAEGVLVVTALFTGSVGLLISARSRRSYRAVIFTYAVLLVLCVVVALPKWLAGGRLMFAGGVTSARVLHVLVSISPLQAMLSAIRPDLPCRQTVGLWPSWAMYLVIAAGMVALASATIFHTLAEPFAPPRPRERLKVVERNKVLTARSMFFLLFFDPARRKPMTRRWQNPVAVKEFRTRPLLQPHWLLRAASLCAVISILLMLLVTLTVSSLVQQGSSQVGRMLSVVAALQVLAIALLGPALAAGSICGDRESGVWDLMRTSKLRSLTIVSGKAQAAIIPLLLLIAAVLPGQLILAYFGPGLAPRIVRVLTVVALTSVFTVALGMFFSAATSRTSRATAWTYAVIAAITVLSLLALAAGDIFSAEVLRAVFTVNPVAAALDAAGEPSFQQYAIYEPFLVVMSVATVVLLSASAGLVWRLRQPD